MTLAKTTHPRLVAIVEDDSGLREAIKDLLTSASLPSRAFRTAEGFLRCNGIRRFGCLIVDGQLPGMSGIALHEHLLSRGIAIPTVVISAHDESRRRLPKGGSSQGPMAVLGKPFDGNDFLRAVRAILRKGGVLKQAKTTRKDVLPDLKG